MTPFSFRPHQKEVIDQAIESLKNPLKKGVIISAPCGFGKSLSSVLIADTGFTPAYYLTPLNTQIKQLREDKLTRHYLTELKGKEHYACENWKNCKRGSEMECRSENCPYKEALGRAVSSHILLTNFMLALVHPALKKRRLCIIDEGQGMGQFVLSLISLNFSEDRYSLPERGEDVLEWSNRTISSIREKIDVVSDTDTIIKYKEQIAHLERFKREYNPDTWFNYFTDTWHYKKRAYIRHFISKPLNLEEYIKKSVELLGEKFIVSSATPPFPSEIGYMDSEVEYIEVPSIFPVENRPCYFLPIGRMGREHKEGNFPRMGSMISAISKGMSIKSKEGVIKGMKGKTLVHAHSYINAQALSEHLTVEHTLQNEDGRDKIFEWKGSSTPLFISVNFEEGLDLPDDSCRNNIILKLPFPYEADPYVKEKIKKFGRDWYNKETARKICQAYGRSTRHEKDFSNTWLLDSDFLWFYKRNKELFPRWFREALQCLT